MNKKPNVIFILSDQHNAKLLGHKGHRLVKTPAMDKMASRGVRFDNAVTQNPICTPSRVSWLSGQYCHNHGYYGLNGAHPGRLPSLLDHFRANGYSTAAIGKIHCPEYWVEDGADLFLETAGHCSIGGGPEYHGYLQDKGVWQDYVDGRGRKSPDGHGQALDGFPMTLSYRDGQQGWAATKAMEYMGGCIEEDKPFFLHLSYPKPHQVYCPAKEFWDMYEDLDESVLPPNADADLSQKAPNLQRTAQSQRQGGWVEFEPKTYEAGRLRKMRGYLGCITETDYAIGEILDFLKEKGIEEDTIIVYSSDHGDYACEFGIIEKAPGICSDAITRVPYIWQWKGHLDEGAVKLELVETVDLAPTLCSLAGLPAMNTADGKDISLLLTGGSGEVHKVAVTEFAWSKSVRKGDWRFVFYPNDRFPEEYPDGFGELYNLKDDPWEMTNLWFDPEYRDKVAEMTRDLAEWLVTTARCKTVMKHLEPEAGPGWETRYNNTVSSGDGRIGYEQVRKTRRGNYL